MQVEELLLLRVVEASPRDVGRTIVRLDPADLQALGANVGDVVEIKGEGGLTAAKVLPAFVEDRGKRQVQMDGILRTNCGASLEGEVQVRLVSALPARSLTISPLGNGSNWQQFSSNRHSLYFKRMFEGMVLLPGNIVRVNLFGSAYQEFMVEEAQPAGSPLVVSPSTNLRLRDVKPEAAARPRLRRNGSVITYEDIGGLSRELGRIREMIELPLKHPEVFERLGIEAPKGVLLYGPPGTGKTMIARAVAGEANAYFISVNGPEIAHSLYGQSEAHLRKIFQEAQSRAPSIIFLDEIDAIAPKRSEAFHEIDRRIVAQLLALMDGLQARGKVVVIGATNLPDNLDPALRRPGRFDREISIKVPDRNGRREILDIYTRGMPLSDAFDLDHLADITHGFVGADLAALCREAALASLRRLFPDFEFVQGAFSFDQLLSLRVDMVDFKTALAEIEPSALREVYTEVPNVTWEQVGGLDNVKKTLQEAVEWPLRYGHLLKQVGARAPKGVLLYGPPGTGKTLVAQAIASQGGINFITVRGPELLSKWVGESEKAVREIFKKARAAAPCIVFLDELDSLAPLRGQNALDPVGERVVAQLLTEMDGVASSEGVIVIGATNRPDMLDPALLRPGRFDTKIELGLPDDQTRLQILRVHMSGKPLANPELITQLVEETEGWSGADIEVFCNRAALNALGRLITATSGDEQALAQTPVITRQDLDDALDTIESQRYSQVVSSAGVNAASASEDEEE
ncbi:MAG TPA: CDC48 family AAA ATPase [Chloroflexia bacterium]|nr:CDC48 family AAA ATPase [Chloroflexia bacterium]